MLKLDDMKNRPEVWNVLQMQGNPLMPAKHAGFGGEGIFTCQTGWFCDLLMKALCFLRAKRKAWRGFSCSLSLSAPRCLCLFAHHLPEAM